MAVSLSVFDRVYSVERDAHFTQHQYALSGCYVVVEHAPIEPLLSTAPSPAPRDRALDLLKWLAMLCMVLDHLRYVGLSLDVLFVPGRLAFAFFCLAIAVNVRRSERRASDWRRELRYLGWLGVFALLSEWPYRLYIPEIDSLNVLPTLMLGMLLANAVWRRTPGWLAIGVVVLGVAYQFHLWLMFDFFGVLLPSAMLLGLRFGPWTWIVPGLCCLAANDWPVILPLAQRGVGLFEGALTFCLIGPAIGLTLLRQRLPFRVPPMRRWAYAIYPLHFLALLGVRHYLAL